ncbi:hypothetical protein [Roseibium sp. M-1]
MLIPLYIILAIYLLTLSVTLYRSRHLKEGQKIAGLRPLLIAAVILLLGSVIANAAYNFIGAAYLFIALMVAAPLFAFGLGRVLATALTWMRRFRAVFALAVILAGCSPIALLAFLELTWFQHQQALQTKLLAFQMKNLEATFDSQRIRLPIHPRLSIRHTCFDEQVGYEKNCHTFFNADDAPELGSTSLHRAPPRLLSLEVRQLSRFLRCNQPMKSDCLKTSDPRLWCERRSDSFAKAWCEIMPEYHMVFEYRETRPENIRGWQGADQDVLAGQINIKDREKVSLQCDEKAKSYCKFHYKLTDNVLVSAYFQQIDRNSAPRRAEDAVKRAHRIWKLMTDPGND